MLWNANKSAFVLIKTDAALRRFGLSLVVPDTIRNSYKSLLTEIENTDFTNKITQNREDKNYDLRRHFGPCTRT